MAQAGYLDWLNDSQRAVVKFGSGDARSASVGLAGGFVA